MSIQYLNREGDFLLENADENSYLYFPIGNEKGVMSSITPTLHGDSKINQNAFLLEPVSSENLHTTNMGRNMWFRIDDEILWSINGISPMQQMHKAMHSEKADKVSVKAGKMWHQVIRTNKEIGIHTEVLSYAPIHAQAEIMKVTVTNTSNKKMQITPYIAIPIYGRSAENYRDHRHVTSLLHRSFIREYGVEVRPTLSFDERGHQLNNVCYGVFAKGEEGENPVGFYPVLEEFIGEGGTLSLPQTITENIDSKYGVGDEIDGFETIGAMKFAARVLNVGETYTYRIVLSYNNEGLELLDGDQESMAFEAMKAYWKKQSSIAVKTNDNEFDYWLNWVGIQPTLRRIYGCSFLPHHDYGKGGRGFRDLWQDSLALILLSMESVRENLMNYYGGIRIDGSNATIIGSKPGEFIADRNSIVRLWMDHGLWPFITTLLYIHQTGDTDILFEEKTYFKDAITYRGTQKDGLWNGSDKELRTYANKLYTGTILEHILIQHLTVFFDVGEHGHLKLRDADWNDALDMARENGESVAFSAAYAGNLEKLSQLLLWLEVEKGIQTVELAKEIYELIGHNQEVYKDVIQRRATLEQYCKSCSGYISGEKMIINIEELSVDLHTKAEVLKENIRQQEIVSDCKGNTWFNSYYDNSKNQVEGLFKNNVRMMLTGQVFTIMSQTADDTQVSKIVKAVNQYLFDASVGGYRLNTNFNEIKSDLGRMFGFAYGHKENGAVFSHMAVMYAYALYSRGFIKEGYKVISQLFKQATNFKQSHIYPGIPEYFNSKGRGMYHYLTGAASWYMLTVLTEMFGVKGRFGDLMLEPKLMAEQFNEDGITYVQSYFAGRKITVVYENHAHKEIGDYEIEEIYIDNKLYENRGEKHIVKRANIALLDEQKEHYIRVKLG